LIFCITFFISCRYSILMDLFINCNCMVVHKFSPFSNHSFARLPLWTRRNYMIFESDVNATDNTRSCCIVLDVGGSFSAVNADHRARSFRERATEWRSIGVEWRASPFSRCSLVRHRSWRRNPQLLVVVRLFDELDWTSGGRKRINVMALTLSISNNAIHTRNIMHIIKSYFYTILILLYYYTSYTTFTKGKLFGKISMYRKFCEFLKR